MKKIIVFSAVLLVIVAGCKVHRNVQKNSSYTDSTATMVNKAGKNTNIYQQANKHSRDTSYNNMQSDYQRQIIKYQFAGYIGSPYIADTLNSLFPAALQNRLIEITVTTEKGTQNNQTGNVSNRAADWLKTQRDSAGREELNNITLKNETEAKETDKTSTGGGGWGWLWFVGILLAGFVIAKRREIAQFVKKKASSL